MNETTVRIMGFEFKPLTYPDRYAFEGAEEDAMICYPNPDDEKEMLVLIWVPSTRTLVEMWREPSGIDRSREYILSLEI